MRVNPASAAYRYTKRPSRPDNASNASDEQGFAPTALPMPQEPPVERQHRAFVDFVHMDAAFLTQVIVSRDEDAIAGTSLRSEAFFGANAYRATAALPRQRAVGHVLSEDR